MTSTQLQERIFCHLEADRRSMEPSGLEDPAYRAIIGAENDLDIIINDLDHYECENCMELFTDEFLDHDVDQNCLCKSCFNKLIGFEDDDSYAYGEPHRTWYGKRLS